MSDFYQTFFQLCESKGIAPSKVAQEIGLNKSSVSYWKKGSIPKMDTLKALAQYFNVTVDYLTGLDDLEATIVQEVSAPGGLVLLKPIGSRMEPYTTADTVAKYAQVQQQTVEHIIRKHKSDLEEFGVLGFEIRLPPAGSKGGRPVKLYHLNEQQATLLITYLKNTPPVRRFKKALVRGFFEARQELARREAQRAVKAPVRRSLTDAIRDSGENERMHGQAFATYTNLVYKVAIGRTAPQIRKAAGVDRRADVVPLLTADELAAVTRREAQVCTLLDCGMQYEAIKSVMTREVNHA